jgi:hypothetical protein
VLEVPLGAEVPEGEDPLFVAVAALLAVETGAMPSKGATLVQVAAWFVVKLPGPSR